MSEQRLEHQRFYSILNTLEQNIGRNYLKYAAFFSGLARNLWK
jgi:hypothetical protein